MKNKPKIGQIWKQIKHNPFDRDDQFFEFPFLIVRSRNQRVTILYNGELFTVWMGLFNYCEPVD